MVRYTADHKQETRRRILDAAARQFRERGVQGAGVASVMKEAELTHGGFYAHFDSKADLVAEVLRHPLREVSESFLARFEDLPPRERLDAWIRHYLSPGHRDRMAEGCPFPALTADTSRGDDAIRGAYHELFLQRVEAMRPIAIEAGVPEAEAESRLFATLTQVIGALAVARSLSDPESTRVLDAAADAAVRTLLGAARADAPGGDGDVA